MEKIKLFFKKLWISMTSASAALVAQIVLLLGVTIVMAGDAFLEFDIRSIRNLVLYLAVAIAYLVMAIRNDITLREIKFLGSDKYPKVDNGPQNHDG